MVSAVANEPGSTVVGRAAEDYGLMSPGAYSPMQSPVTVAATADGRPVTNPLAAAGPASSPKKGSPGNMNNGAELHKIEESFEDIKIELDDDTPRHGPKSGGGPTEFLPGEI